MPIIAYIINVHPSRSLFPKIHSSVSIALQHTIHQIPQRPPEIFPARQAMLVDEENVMLEARVQMRLQAQLHDDGVVVAVDVRVDAVQALEELPDEGREVFREWYT